MERRQSGKSTVGGDASDVSSGQNDAGNGSELRPEDFKVKVELKLHHEDRARLAFNAFLLRFLSLVLGVDLWATVYSKRVKFLELLTPYRGSRWFRLNRGPWIRLLLVPYVISLMHLLTSVYYQYSHDWNLKRLERLRSCILSKADSGDSLDQSRQLELAKRHELYLVERINSTAAVLALVGAPHLGSPFATECYYLLLIIFSVAYPQSQYYYSFVVPFDFRVVRVMLDRQAAQRNVDRLVCEVANKFITSSRNFVQAFGLKRPSEYQKFLRSGQERPISRFTSVEDRSALLEHSLTCHQIRLMASSGELQPLNMCPKQVAANARTFFNISAFLILNCLVYDILIASSLTVLAEATEGHRTKFADLIIISELVFLVGLANFMAILFPGLALVNCLDQLKYVKKLKVQIGHCGRLNSDKFRHCLKLAEECRQQQPVANEHKSNKQLQIDCCHEQMNIDLLFALLQFKIFVAQFKQYKKSFGLVLAWAVLLTFVFPILGRLHIGYISAALHRDFRYLVSIINLTVLACTNLCLIPACCVHSRCLELYKALSSLLAHVTCLMCYPQGEKIYSKHTIYALRKEMNYPKLLLAEFETNSGGIRLTYGSMLAFHFWFGLIGLSIFLDAKWSGRYGSLSMFHDPFGVYHHLGRLELADCS